MIEKRFNLRLKSDNKKETIKNSAVIITFIVLFAGIIIGAGMLLGSRIEKNAERDIYEAFPRVVKASSFSKLNFSLEAESGVLGLYGAKEKGKAVGYCAVVECDGYSGKIKMVVGFDMNGKVSAIEIISSEDTKATGGRVSGKDFLSAFVGKDKIQTAVRGLPKSENQVSVVSGATTSSKAVVRAINNSIEAVSMYRAEQQMKGAK